MHAVANDAAPHAALNAALHARGSRSRRPCRRRTFNRSHRILPPGRARSPRRLLFVAAGTPRRVPAGVFAHVCAQVSAYMSAFT